MRRLRTVSSATPTMAASPCSVMCPAATGVAPPDVTEPDDTGRCGRNEGVVPDCTGAARGSVGTIPDVKGLEPGTAIAAVLFTDLVGSTSLLVELGDDRADALRRELDHVLRQEV